MNSQRNSNQMRPITRVSDDILRTGNVLLCCGEDYPALMDALNPVVNALPRAFHRYRGYNFTAYQGFTIVSTGFGTGCLDPLLYEILGQTTRIVAIGSARLVHQTSEMLGRVYLVRQAVLEGPGIVSAPASAPRLTFPAVPEMPSIGVVSGESYYSLRTAPTDLFEKAPLDAAPNGLAPQEQTLMIDCDTAQFYRLCELYGSSDLAYAAIKGAPHQSFDDTESQFNTRAVLRECGRNAVSMLLQE